MPIAWASEEDPLWSRPCLAYNLQAELGDACRDDLFQVQDKLQLPRSWTLRCLPASLHVSVAHDAVGEGGLRHLRRRHLGALGQTMV